ATNNRALYERNYAWLFGVNVLVALLLLAVLAWVAVRLAMRLRKGRFGSRLLVSPHALHDLAHQRRDFLVARLGILHRGDAGVGVDRSQVDGGIGLGEIGLQQRQDRVDVDVGLGRRGLHLGQRVQRAREAVDLRLQFAAQGLDLGVVQRADQRDGAVDAAVHLTHLGLHGHRRHEDLVALLAGLVGGDDLAQRQHAVAQADGQHDGQCRHRRQQHLGSQLHLQPSSIAAGVGRAAGQDWPAMRRVYL
ncbi:MAG: hypothetical protein EOP39_26625, partial [Rubrivivax sp.]